MNDRIAEGSYRKPVGGLFLVASEHSFFKGLPILVGDIKGLLISAKG